MAQRNDTTVIGEIKKRISDNELGLVWLTPEIMLETKTIVRQSKKYYLGTWNGKNDSSLFWPLVKSHVDSIVGNLDYDVGDIRIISSVSKFRGTAYLLTELLRERLRKGKFGLLMNETAQSLVRDGTVVVRTSDKLGEFGSPESFLVDIENLWFDSNTNESTWFAERVAIPKYSVPKSWSTEHITEGSASKFKDTGDKIHSDVIIAYRYEGLMPRGWINNTNDTDEVYGLIWLTGMENDGETYVQSRKILGKDRRARSYDYAQFIPSQNRFISVGIPEALTELQRYINIVINNRVERGKLASVGIVEIRKGSGINAKDVKRMRAGDAIVVSQLGKDIASTPVQDVSAVSFNEEQSISNISDLLTGSTEVSRGQINRSGTTLGQANLEAGFSNQRFQFHREALGFMFESILYKWLKLIVAKMDKEEVVNITDKQTLQELSQDQAKFDQMQIAQNISQTTGEVAGLNAIRNPALTEELVSRRVTKNEWKIVKENLKDFEYKIEVSVNSEAKDLNAIANNIVQTLPLVVNNPELAQPMINKLFEILGLHSAELK